MRSTVDGIDLNRSNDIKTSLLKTERQTASARK